MSAMPLSYSSSFHHRSSRYSYHHCDRFHGKCQAVWTHIFAVIPVPDLCLTAVWICECSFVDIHEILWYLFQRIRSYRRILYPYNWRLFSFRLWLRCSNLKIPPAVLHPIPDIFFKVLDSRGFLFQYPPTHESSENTVLILLCFLAIASPLSLFY